MAVCQASVMDPLGAAVAVVMPRLGSCATMAAAPANMARLVSAIALVDPPHSSAMVSSLRSHRFPGGLFDWLDIAERAGVWRRQLWRTQRALIRQALQSFCDQSDAAPLHMPRGPRTRS